MWKMSLPAALRAAGESLVERLRGFLQPALALGPASRPALDPSTPPDPVLDADASALPGTGNRAFWVGSSVVCLSLVSGLATYLILTGLTPIVPKNSIVLGVLAANLILVIAMV